MEEKCFHFEDGTHAELWKLLRNKADESNKEITKTMKNRAGHKELCLCRSRESPRQNPEGRAGVWMTEQTVGDVQDWMRAGGQWGDVL